MRANDTTDELLSGYASYKAVISAWRGGELLTPEPIPLLSGNVTASVAQQVSERLTLRVPRWDGRDWSPGTDVSHPLARFGQELSVAIRVGSSVSDLEYDTQVGRFLITDWSADETSVSVTGAGLLQRVADDELVSPMTSRADGTLVSEARRLLPLGMFAGFHPDLVDRPCPPTEWGEDRLAALYEIAAAWPARLRMDPWGQVQFLPPLPDAPSPVVTVQNYHPRGTLLSATRSDTRAGGFNRVVMRSSAPGMQGIQAVTEQRTGPMSVDPPYGAVTTKETSPLLTTTEALFRASNAWLRKSLLPTRVIPVRCLADPRLELDDPVEVIHDGKLDWGWVVGYDLPLVADGEARLDVGLAS